jgi:hypothetical protein
MRLVRHRAQQLKLNRHGFHPSRALEQVPTFCRKKDDCRLGWVWRARGLPRVRCRLSHGQQCRMQQGAWVRDHTNSLTRACWHYSISKKSDLARTVQQFILDVNTIADYAVGTICTTNDILNAKEVNECLNARGCAQRVKVLLRLYSVIHWLAHCNRFIFPLLHMARALCQCMHARGTVIRHIWNICWHFIVVEW